MKILLFAKKQTIFLCKNYDLLFKDNTENSYSLKILFHAGLKNYRFNNYIFIFMNSFAVIIAENSENR